MKRFLGCGLIIGFSFLGWRISAAEGFCEKVDLFESGQGGYALYRIPGVVVTAKGTALAYCEARRAGGDWAAMDVLMRRSVDGGRTWDEARKVADVPGTKPKNPVRTKANPAETTYNNPVAMAEQNGRVHLLFCLEYFRCFHVSSDDDGVTWSKPVEITEAFAGFRPGFDWKVIATGPGHGIQLRNGRLVAPAWLALGQGPNNHSPSESAVIYSDDHGEHWRHGDIVISNTEATPNASETELIELADGRVLMNARSQLNQRLVSISPNGATGWSKPVPQAELNAPVCMAGLVRYSAKAGVGRSGILFSQPSPADGPEPASAGGKARDRINLIVRLSYDEGETWPVKKLLEPGPAAYSDLAVLPDGTVLCFYERGNPAKGGDQTPYGLLTVARFDLRWLTEGAK